MLPTQSGAFRLFRFRGIQVFLHWSWFVVGVYEINLRSKNYSSLTWNIAEYLALFLIVLLHEFGHSLACRSVGGEAEQIVLWPLGGVAYVNPPQRPGAVLWSIAAGPLVNVALLLVSIVALIFLSLPVTSLFHPQLLLPDMESFVFTLAQINLVLLLFNLLPVYPLDGGQILRALLWFLIGAGWSLIVASVVGVAGGIALLGLAFWKKSYWFGILAFFVLSRALVGFRLGKMHLAMAKISRHPDFTCPSCGHAPRVGALWRCATCGEAFDPFETEAVCPKCDTASPITACPECRQSHPISEWRAGT